MDAIFTFHSIDPSPLLLSYSRDDFEMFLDALAEERVRIVPLAELLEPASDGVHRAVLTFDDGLLTVRAAALPILLRRAVPATAYVVSDWVGRTNRWPSQPRAVPCLALMTWTHLRELRDAGIRIGSHSASHRPLRQLDEPSWDEELRGSRARLEDELQVAVSDFAYPYGHRDAEAVRRVRAVYATAVTSDLGFASGAAPHLLPRIDTYYLRSPRRHAPVFGPRTRAYLALRAMLRRIRDATMG